MMKELFSSPVTLVIEIEGLTGQLVSPSTDGGQPTTPGGKFAPSRDRLNM